MKKMSIYPHISKSLRSPFNQWMTFLYIICGREFVVSRYKIKYLLPNSNLKSFKAVCKIHTLK